MPGWQALYEELAEDGLTVVTIAVDSAEAARPWIERAAPTHPSLIDDRQIFVDRYHVVNVPTVLWIDERGQIVRPNDVAFTSERGGEYAGVSTAAQMAALRAWVRGTAALPDAATVRSQQQLPSVDDQQARAHLAL
ncbi:MAG: TlpA disulfide reductase family protein, partial [Chloroflexi bacterium]|nr:TlpA disulfide reductase family protein [Chloroflexota bacterium]